MPHSSAELRRAFLDFFAARGHEVVPSSPLIPANDPTLLFTNAGMVQFKDVFLGTEHRKNPRAASAQRCVRAGGKHNDLENVGYTARHHTFFEMLGNFSFGDYFKREAIHYAWEFVTGVLGLPPERLWCTVYEDDDEAARIWLDEIGVDARRFARLDENANFWSMGETGPCGPCTEIFYDHGSDVAGGPPGSPDEDGDRYVEIWNLVFMQFDRAADGRLTPLPKPSVDTGLGLERLAAVMQGVHSNYDIDLFVRLIDDAAALTGADDRQSKSLRVIADHIRACTFLIADGVVPDKEGRGYVLRRIVRRALRHGYKLGVEEPFFHRLVASVEREMGDAYPELSKRRAHVERVLLKEEQRFAETLSQGMRLLEDAIAKLPAGREIPGDVVFKLSDTYGFPEDLTADFARERGFRIDRAGFERHLENQRRRAREASQFGVKGDSAALAAEATRIAQERGVAATRFLGYEGTTAEARVVALFDSQSRAVDRLDGDGVVVLDATPFYAESGGQVGDSGTLRSQSGVFEVRDTRKLGALFGHFCAHGRGSLAVGDVVSAAVDAERRAAIVRNHSATHLLHAALRDVLGTHVQQKGSLVAPERLRFDFTHYAPVAAAELRRVEHLVNEQIRANAAAETRIMPFKDAMAAGALAFFDDKYGEEVRVLSLGGYSTELCGGTHVSRAGDIGLLKIVSESGIAAGVRRIEAVTGLGALEWLEATDAALASVAALVKSGRDDVADKVGLLIEKNRQLEREVQVLKTKLATGESRDLIGEAETVGAIKVLVARVDDVDAKALRDRADHLRDRLGTGIVVLGAVDAEKVRLVVTVSSDLTARYKAGELIAPIADIVGGRGGGRPDFAQAGGSLPERLDEALDHARERLRAAG